MTEKNIEINEPGDEEVRDANSPADDAQPQTGDTPPAPAEDMQALRDQLLRKVAEFENFKRRTREEKEILTQLGTEILMRDLLPVIDDFERSLEAGRDHADFNAFYDGVQIIYNKLLRTLEQRGLQPMNAKGKPFDVEYHDALLQVPSSEVEPGTVVDVIEKGYLMRDRVLRHAKVTVARESDSDTSNTEPQA
jgi:molecular chaperone GrpE